MKTIAGRSLRIYRFDNDLNQDSLGSLLDTSQDRISTYETGAQTPGLRTAVAIEKLTDIPPRDWLEPVRRAS